MSDHYLHENIFSFPEQFQSRWFSTYPHGVHAYPISFPKWANVQVKRHNLSETRAMSDLLQLKLLLSDQRTLSWNQIRLFIYVKRVSNKSTIRCIIISSTLDSALSYVFQVSMYVLLNFKHTIIVWGKTVSEVKLTKG